MQSSLTFSLAALGCREPDADRIVSARGTGNALGNMLTGNSGANVLTGLGGNDTLEWRRRRRHVDRRYRERHYVVDNAGDVVTENAAKAPIRCSRR